MNREKRKDIRSYANNRKSECFIFLHRKLEAMQISENQKNILIELANSLVYIDLYKIIVLERFFKAFTKFIS